MAKRKRLRVGIFSFTGDEGCIIMFLELLNTYFFKWRDMIEFKYARVLQSRNVVKDIDVAFVEGAISTPREEKRIKEIRKNSKRVVAVGSCATEGAPSNHRNFFDAARKKEIEHVIKKFKLNWRVEPLSMFIKVDGIVPGCPMMGGKFVEVLNGYFKEFGIKKPK
jgi:coenzyme F420-reducing hydrogenase gamma subunit